MHHAALGSLGCIRYLDGQGVGSLDTRRVCPPSNTTYRLVATRGSERVERNVTITVASSTPPPQVNFSIIGIGRRWTMCPTAMGCRQCEGNRSGWPGRYRPRDQTSLPAGNDDVHFACLDRRWRHQPFSHPQRGPAAPVRLRHSFWADSSGVHRAGSVHDVALEYERCTVVSLDGRRVAGQGSSPVCPGSDGLTVWAESGWTGGIADRAVTVDGG